MPSGSALIRRSSRRVSDPSTAYTTTCVSRFSIRSPTDTSAEDIALDSHLALHAADQGLSGPRDRQELCHRLAALGDNDSFRIDPVEKRQALLLELRRSDGFHGQILRLVT